VGTSGKPNWQDDPTIEHEQVPFDGGHLGESMVMGLKPT